MITYSLVGVDDEGNIKVDITLPRELAAVIALEVLEAGFALTTVKTVGSIEKEPLQKFADDTIQQINKKHGKKLEAKEKVSNRKSKLPDDMQDKVVSLFKTGLPIRDVAAKAGVSYSTAFRLLNKAGVDTSANSKKPVEKTNAASAVTDEEILALHHDDYSNHAIEARLGVNRGRIAQVLAKHGIKSEHQKGTTETRCIKCGKRGHIPARCPTGDALDRLDGEKQPRKRLGAMTQHHFEQCRLSSAHEIPPAVIARELNLSLIEVEKSITALNYDSYSI